MGINLKSIFLLSLDSISYLSSGDKFRIHSGASNRGSRIERSFAFPASFLMLLICWKWPLSSEAESMSSPGVSSKGLPEGAMMCLGCAAMKDVIFCLMLILGIEKLALRRDGWKLTVKRGKTGTRSKMLVIRYGMGIPWLIVLYPTILVVVYVGQDCGGGVNGGHATLGDDLRIGKWRLGDLPMVNCGACGSHHDWIPGVPRPWLSKFIVRTFPLTTKSNNWTSGRGDAGFCYLLLVSLMQSVWGRGYWC